MGMLRTVGNGEAKELICTTHGHELSGERITGGNVGTGQKEANGENWDNYNSTINKMYF